MGTGESAAELLAAGAEALLEAAFRTGDYADIQTRLQAARVRAGADGDRATKAAALDRLGWLLHFQALDHGVEHADADAEEALFQQALAIRRDIQDPAGVAGSLFGVGLVQQVLRRDWDAAMPYFWEALALADQHGDELTRSEVHRHVGFFYLVNDVQPDRALHHLRISLQLRERHGDPRWIPSGTLALGQGELAAGNRAEAIRRLREAVGQARAAGLRQRRIDQAEEALRRAEAGGPPTHR
jgi:tetratricopeptide (TPR) repeat protein